MKTFQQFNEDQAAPAQPTAQPAQQAQPIQPAAPTQATQQTPQQAQKPAPAPQKTDKELAQEINGKISELSKAGKTVVDVVNALKARYSATPAMAGDMIKNWVVSQHIQAPAK